MDLHTNALRIDMKMFSLATVYFLGNMYDVSEVCSVRQKRSIPNL